MKTLLLTLWRIAAIAVLVAIVSPFAWEKISSDYFMTVTGVSMEPTYHVGDVLIVQAPNGNELSHLGDPVIVAFTPGDKKTQYVHRTHEITPNGTFLKGDNNDTVDPTPVTQAHVMGTPRAALTGWTAGLYHLSQNLVIRIATAVILIPAFLVSTRRKRPGAAHPAEAPIADARPAITESTLNPSQAGSDR